MLYRTQNPHGGDVYGAEVAFDFSSNVNPLGTPPNVLAAISHAAMRVRQYPDPYCRALTAAIAAHEAVPEDFILCGAGAAELIYAYCDALRPKKAMELAPTFLEYSAAASHFGAEMVRVPLQAPEFLPDSKILDKLQEKRRTCSFSARRITPRGKRSAGRFSKACWTSPLRRARACCSMSAFSTLRAKKVRRICWPVMKIF